MADLRPGWPESAARGRADMACASPPPGAVFLTAARQASTLAADAFFPAAAGVPAPFGKLAGLSYKFLRIYYGRVKEYLASLEQDSVPDQNHHT